MMCVMALKENTARRAARQHLSAAQNGTAQGRIAHGWVHKGEHWGQLAPGEADIVTPSSGASSQASPPTPSPTPASRPRSVPLRACQ